MHYDYKEFMGLLGLRVRALRKHKGWSLRDMILEHGYHDTQWRKIERGEGISIPSLLKIAELFDISVSQLLDGLGEAPEKSLEAIKECMGPAADKKKRAPRNSPLRSRGT